MKEDDGFSPMLLEMTHEELLGETNENEESPVIPFEMTMDNINIPNHLIGLQPN